VPGSDPSAGVADILRDLERARLHALVDADLATADALHAADYQLITPGGAALTKSEYLGGIADGTLDYRTFEAVSDVALRTFADVCVLRYRARIEILVAGTLDEGLFWHTDTYERRDGRWQAVWSQATRIRS
jgi:hypothetical protein